jgi:hypothetical protein
MPGIAESISGRSQAKTQTMPDYDRGLFSQRWKNAAGISESMSVIGA